MSGALYLVFKRWNREWVAARRVRGEGTRIGELDASNPTAAISAILVQHLNREGVTAEDLRLAEEEWSRLLAGFTAQRARDIEAELDRNFVSGTVTL